MTDKQPEALRLADRLTMSDYYEFDAALHCPQAAAELRRLHALNADRELELTGLMGQVMQQQAVMRQALEALEGSVTAMRGLYGGWRCESALKQADIQITALREQLEGKK